MKKTGGDEKGITRREFLKGTAGLMIALSSGVTLKGLADVVRPEEDPVGPQLREELESNSTLMRNKFLSDLVFGNIDHAEAMQKASTLNLYSVLLLSLLY